MQILNDVDIFVVHSHDIIYAMFDNEEEAETYMEKEQKDLLNELSVCLVDELYAVGFDAGVAWQENDSRTR